MSDQTRASMELNCPGCGAFFRLKPQKDKPPKGPLPCPKCETLIPLASPEPEEKAPPKSKVMGLGIIKRRKASPNSTQKSPPRPKSPSSPPAREFMQSRRDETVKTQQLDPDSEWDALDISATGAIGPLNTSSTYLGLPVQRFQAEPEPTVVSQHPVMTAPTDADDAAPKHTTGRSAIAPKAQFSREQTVADNQAILAKLRQVQSTRDLDPVKPEDLAPPDVRGAINPSRITAEFDQVPHVRQTPMSMDKLDRLFEDEDLETQARVKPQDISWQDADSPFDLKDILDAEKTLGNNISGDITRNPALDGSMHIRPDPPSAPEVSETFGTGAPRPRSGQVSRLSLDVLDQSVDSDNDRSGSGAFQHARVSTGDIFSEVSLSMQDIPHASVSVPLPEVDSDEMLSAVSDIDDSTEGMGVMKTPAPKASMQRPSPSGNLAARLKKKVGSSGLSKLRDQIDQAAQHESVESVSSPDRSVETLEIHDMDALIAEAIDDSEVSSIELSEPLPFNVPSLGQAPSLPLPDITENPAKSTAWGRPNSDLTIKHLSKKLDAQSLPKQTPHVLNLDPPELFPQAAGLNDALSAPSSTQEYVHDGDLSGIPLISGFPKASQAADDLKIIRSKSRRADDSYSGLIKPLAQTLHEESSVISGTAGERRGSGYIRLPTTEILNVLGEGRYRLMVEGIVYEPVDQQALTQLIKQGVLMGAEMIADEHSDWTPIAEHPVFRRLRKKMAIEAHALLAKYKREADQASAPHVDVVPPSPNEHSAATRENIPAHVNELSELGEPSEPLAPLEREPVEESDAEMLEQLLGISEADAISDAVDSEERQQPILADEPLVDASREPARPSVVEPTAGLTKPEEPLPDDYDALYIAPSSFSWKLPVALLIVACLVGAGLFLADRFTPSTPKQPAPPEQKITKIPVVVPDTPTEEPAKDITPKEKEEPSAQRAKALIDQKEHVKALAMLDVLTRAEPEDLALRALRIQALFVASQYREARTLAVKTLAQPLDEPQRSAWRALYVQSIKDDAQLTMTTPKTLDSSFATRVVSSTPERTHQTWKIETAQGPYTFTTSRPESSGHWSSEVASWRLCQMMLCPFEVPETVPARVLKSDLVAWINASDLPNKSADIGRITQTKADLREQKDPRGEDSVYVYGALQQQAKEVAPFPIEFKSLWAAMVNVREDPKMLERPIKAVLAPLDKFESGRFAAAINEQVSNLDTMAFVSQLSTMLLVDYLINHRPRFQKGRVNYGTSTGLHDGRLYTTGHEDSWGLRASSTIRSRFRYISRFSARSVAALPLLDPSFADAVLFPDPTSTQEKRLKVFWSQRDRALSRIKTLEDGYTTTRVMSLP